MKTIQMPWDLPRALPRLRVGLTTFVIDLRLREFRMEEPPFRPIRFDAPKGMQLAARVGIMRCLGCGRSFIVDPDTDPDDLLCPFCCSPVEGAKPL